MNGTISIEIINDLLNQNKIVGIHDPYMEREELQSINERCEVLLFPESLSEYDAVFILTGHEIYKDFEAISKYLKKGCTIIDNLGFLNNSDMSKYKYYEIGNNEFD